uniref:SPT6_acidic domain-containing protein n=1 Tax=Globodera pallida TaxID=36090 RepID=A0A183CC59_GLOPA
MTEESNSGSPLPSTSDPGSAAKRARMVSNLEMEEDEEMTTTDEEREAAKANTVTVFEEDDDVEEEEEEAPLPEALALTRARRPNAGRKMAELMAQQMNDKDDDFYGTAYGGFGE